MEKSNYINFPVTKNGKQMYHCSIIKADAYMSIQSYKETNPTAFEFLNLISKNEREGFWLSTAVNAHLYYQNAYFAYIKFHPIELEFIQQFNMRIHAGTVDVSSFLFGERLKELARKHDLLTSRIVSFYGTDKMYIKKGAPKAFFDDFQKLIVTIYDELSKD
jgi:hypothetical protein